MGARENKHQKLQISQNEILHMMILPVFSQFLWNLKFIFSGFHKELSLALLQMTNYVYSPWKVYKKSYMASNILVRGFYQLKIEITQFPGGFCLNYLYSIFFSVNVFQFPFSGWIWIWFEVKLAPFLSLILSSFIKDTSRIKLAFKKSGKFAFSSCFQNKTQHS